MKAIIVFVLAICGQSVGLIKEDDVALSTLSKRHKKRVFIFGDTHITGPEYPLNTESTELDNDSVVRSQMRLYAAIKKINALDPSLVLILGDVVHDGLRILQDQVNEEGVKKLFDMSVNGYTIASDIFQTIQAKKLFVWGNHDHLLDCQNPRQSISHRLLGKVYKNYFDADPYHVLRIENWMFISLNSMWGQTWNASDSSCNTELSSFGKVQLDWLDYQLRKNAGQNHVIILMHFPPGTVVLEEEDGQNADLKTVLYRYRHDVKGILSGHFHKGILWGSIFGQIKSITLPSTRYNSENYFSVNLFDNGTWELEDFFKNRKGARCSDSAESTTRDPGNCGTPLVSQEESYLLDPIQSMVQYPNASVFNPEGSCRFQFATQFLDNCLLENYLETDCCEILSQAFWPSSSHPFSACLCQNEFWNKIEAYFDPRAAHKFASLISIDEGFSSKSGALKTSTCTKLSDRFRLKIALEDTLRDVSSIDINLMAKNWSLAHNTRTKDCTLRASWKPSNTVRVNLAQKAPKGKFFLVPNPHLKITQTGGVLGKNNSASLEHDMMARCSGATVCFYGGDDDDEKRHKVKINANSNSGANACIRSKIWKGSLLHSISASGSTRGNVLALKSRIQYGDKKLKTKLSYSTANGSLTMAGTHTLTVDKHKVKTSVTLSAPVTGLTRPSVQVGVNLQV